MVLARQVPEPEWYNAGLFDACISRSPKQNRSNVASKTKINYQEEIIKSAEYSRVQFSEILKILQREFQIPKRLMGIRFPFN